MYVCVSKTASLMSYSEERTPLMQRERRASWTRGMGVDRGFEGANTRFSHGRWSSAGVRELGRGFEEVG